MTSSPTEPLDLAPGAPAPGAVAVVAGHGDFAAGLISAVAQITGRGELLLPITNRGLGPTEIEAALRAAVSLASVRVIFTDLPAGSCTIASRRLLRERPDLRLVTGANLPAVIDFVMSAQLAPPDASQSALAADASAQAVAHAVERGRGALTMVAPPAAPPLVASTAAPGPEVGGAR
jgi:N-acetylgalactosamine PTS system EIIA component